MIRFGIHEHDDSLIKYMFIYACGARFGPDKRIAHIVNGFVLFFARNKTPHASRVCLTCLSNRLNLLFLLVLICSFACFSAFWMKHGEYWLLKALAIIAFQSFRYVRIASGSSLQMVDFFFFVVRTVRNEIAFGFRKLISSHRNDERGLRLPCQMNKSIHAHRAWSSCVGKTTKSRHEIGRSRDPKHICVDGTCIKFWTGDSEVLFCSISHLLAPLK